jgi:trk system potassium uptake protein TrkA
MKAVVIGCGRVGSATRALQAEAGRVRRRREEEALQRLGETGRAASSSATEWRGGAARGRHRGRDAVIVATDGDNTNLVVAQIAQKRFGVSNVVVRVLDPGRATFYDTLGLRTICPTSGAIRALIDAVLTYEAAPA